MRRITELDSLRGLAALAIVTFHLNPPAFYPGWTGVDLFFVLSGFLITSIILRHGQTRGFLTTFYIRRGLRIWPIYYLTLFVLVALNHYATRPESLESLPYYLTYTQNLPLYWRNRAPSLLAFDHTWTLALEEQFYLIWPALVLLAGKKRVIPLCLTTVALAWMARGGGWISWSKFSERILIARCDGFALGGLLAAILETGPSRRKTAGLAVAFVAATAYLVWGVRTDGVHFLGLPTPANPATTTLVVNIAYFGLVGLVATGAGTLWLLPLRFRPLAYLGKISYGLYLYHYPVFWGIDGPKLMYDQPWAVRALKLGTTLALAMASWHLIESPILTWKDRFSYGSGGHAHRPRSSPSAAPTPPDKAVDSASERVVE